MMIQIVSPGTFHRRLECQNQDSFQLHRLRQFIGSKRFAKAHLCIPKEFWRTLGLFLQSRLKVDARYFNGTFLLRAHFKCFVAIFINTLTCTELLDGGKNIFFFTEKPFVSILALIQPSKTSAFKNLVNLFIGKARSIGAHCRFLEEYFSFKACRVQLLLDSGFDITVCKADLDIASKFFYLGDCIGIDGWVDFRTLPEKFV